MDGEIRVPQATMRDILVPIGLFALSWVQWLVFRAMPVAPAATTFIFWLAVYGSCCTLLFSRHVLSRLGSVLVIDETRIRLERNGQAQWELPWSEFGGYLPLKAPGASGITGGKILRKDGQVLASVSFVAGLFRIEGASRRGG